MDIFNTLDDVAAEEDAEMHNYLNPVLRKQRVVRNRPDNFEQWDDVEFKRRFRLQKESVEYLLTLIEDQLKHKTERPAMGDAGPAGGAGVEQQRRRERQSSSNKRAVSAQHSLRKRPPARPLKAHNVVFVTNNTNFKAQLEKCCDLITNGEKEVIIHGLGAAVQRCCNLALQLETLFAGTCQIEVNTGTVDLIDDLEPLTEDSGFGAQVRQSSSVHIRVYRTAVLGANQ